MFCYGLLYCVNKLRGSERVHRDDGEQMEHICLVYFCVRPLNNFSDELGCVVSYWSFTGKITQATKNNKFALFIALYSALVTVQNKTMKHTFL